MSKRGYQGRKAEELISRHAGELWESIHELSGVELTRLIRTAENFTTTNCGWMSYAMRDTVVRVALFEKRNRARRKGEQHD